MSSKLHNNSHITKWNSSFHQAVCGIRPIVPVFLYHHAAFKMHWILSYATQRMHCQSSWSFSSLDWSFFQIFRAKAREYEDQVKQQAHREARINAVVALKQNIDANRVKHLSNVWQYSNVSTRRCNSILVISHLSCLQQILFGCLGFIMVSVVFWSITALSVKGVGELALYGWKY